MTASDHELDRARARQARREGHALPNDLVDLLLQVAVKTETGAALLAGYRLGNPPIGLAMGPCVLEVRGPVVMRLTAVPSEMDAQ